MGVPIKTIDEYRVDREKICVLVAVGNQFHEVIKKSLAERQYGKVYLFDSELRNHMFKVMIQEKLKQFVKDDKR